MPVLKQSPQLGKDFKNLSPKELAALNKKELYLSTKYDGSCVILQYENGELIAYTRELHPLALAELDGLASSMKLFFADTGIRPHIIKLFCELTVRDGKVGDRNEANGIVISSIASAKKGVAPEFKDYKLRVFDSLMLFQRDKFTYAPTFEERLARRNYMFEHLHIKHLRVLRNVAWHKVSSLDLAIETRDMLIDGGYEGVMLADAKAQYEFEKRNTNYVKLKSPFETVGVVTQCFKGEAGKKYETLIGSVEVDTPLGLVRVGSGLGDSVRSWNPVLLIGEKVKIGYESINKKTGVLIQPVFKGFVC